MEGAPSYLSILGWCVVIFFVYVGVDRAIQYNYQHHLVRVVPPLAVSGVSNVFAVYDAPFTATGTLIYYRNNVGPVPWLVYNSASGATTTKSLLFDTPIDLPPASTTIVVSGWLEHEHVRVRTIVPG